MLKEIHMTAINIQPIQYWDQNIWGKYSIHCMGQYIKVGFMAIFDQNYGPLQGGSIEILPNKFHLEFKQTVPI